MTIIALRRVPFEMGTRASRSNPHLFWGVTFVGYITGFGTNEFARALVMSYVTLSQHMAVFVADY